MHMTTPTLQEILRSGERIYLEKLKKALEEKFPAQYVAIDTDSSEYVVDANKLRAVELAKERFGQKLFYIVQIGSLDQPSVNHRIRYEYAWNF